MAVTVQRLTDIDNSIHSLLNNEKIKDAPASDPIKKALEAVDKIVESLIASLKKQDSQGGGTQKQSNSAAPPSTASNQPSSNPPPSDSAKSNSGAALPGSPATASANQAAKTSSSDLEGILEELERALKAQEEEQNSKSTGATGAHHSHHHGHGHHHDAAKSDHAKSGDYSSKPLSVGEASRVSSPSQVVAGKSSPDQIMNYGKEVGSRNTSYGPELAASKKKILDGLNKASPPATDKEKALVMSMFMQETTHMKVAEGDRSKDNNSGGSANFSALNMNADMMKRVSTFDPAINYNDDANIGKAANLCLDGLREKGTVSWIAGHRGGGPASERQDQTGTAVDPSKPDSASYYNQYYDSVATDYKAIMKDPTLLTNDIRVENDAKPVYG